MAKTLQKVNWIGKQWFHEFRTKDGSTTLVETTQQDYEQLGSPNPKNPTLEGATWLHSFERYKFDTLDGTLQDNQYADLVIPSVGSFQIVKIPTAVPAVLPTGAVVANVLQDVAETKIIKDYGNRV